jgi:hypothetical protein
VLLLAFARFGAEAAACAHLASSVLIAALSLIAIGRSLEIPAARLAGVFLPGLALTALTAAVIPGAEFLLSPGEGAPGLALRLAAVSVAWLALVLVFFRRRILVLPTP